MDCLLMYIYTILHILYRKYCAIKFICLKTNINTQRTKNMQIMDMSITIFDPICDVVKRSL